MASHRAKKANTEAPAFHVRHTLGQNFLRDDALLEQLASYSLVGSDDTVLEIGPGLGALTTHLAPRARRVISVEIDERLRPYLALIAEREKNVEFVFDDAMQMNLRDVLLEPLANHESIRVAANLPYYITTDVLQKIVCELPEAKSIAVMVQKEVADKFIAAPGETGYGPFSLRLQRAYALNIACILSPEHFDPSPKVSSAFLVMERLAQPRSSVSDDAALDRLIEISFRMRRKTLANNLAAGLPLSKEDAFNFLSEIKLDVRIRPEQVSLEGYCRLTDALLSSGYLHKR